MARTATRNRPLTTHLASAPTPPQHQIGLTEEGMRAVLAGEQVVKFPNPTAPITGAAWKVQDGLLRVTVKARIEGDDAGIVECQFEHRIDRTESLPVLPYGEAMIGLDCIIVAECIKRQPTDVVALAMLVAQFAKHFAFMPDGIGELRVWVADR